MKNGRVFTTAIFAVVLTSACADGRDPEGDDELGVEEAELIGEAEERPAGTFELGEEGAVDVAEPVPIEGDEEDDDADVEDSDL